MEIFKLFGSILVDSSQAEKSISKTDSQAKSFASSLGSGLKKVGAAAAGIATAAAGAAVAAGKALNSVVNDAATYADTIDKASFRSGLGAENLQRLKYAAEMSGASLENIEKSAKKLNDRLGEVSEGNEKSAEMFEKLGVSVYDAQGNMRNSNDVYNDVLAKLADMRDTAEATAIGTDLFGKAFTDLKPLLAAGSDGINDLMDNADKLGIVMSQDSVTAGVKFGDTVANIKNAVSGAARSLGSSLFPTFQRVADKIISVIPKIQGFAERLIPIVGELAESIIDPLMELIDNVLPDLAEFAESLIQPASELIRSVLPVIISLINKLTPILTKIIQKLLPPLLDILDMLMPVLELIMSFLDPIISLVAALIDPLAEVLNNAVKPIVEVLTRLIEKILGPLGEKLEEFAPLLGDILGGALIAVSGLLTDVLLPAFDALLKFLDGDFLGGLESWGSAFTGIFDSIFAGIDEMFGTHLSEWYDEVKTFWGEVGANLYEMTHGDEINLNELSSKYYTLQGDMFEAIKAEVAAGKTAEEALEAAENKLLDTSEKLYFYNQMKDSWNTAGVAQGYFDNKSAWLYGASDEYENRKNNIVPRGRPPRLATGGIATGSTLAMVGDNPDVRVNPEVIAPLSDLSDMIFTGFSRALDRYAETRWEERSAPAKQPLTIIVQLADGTELTRAFIDNINEIARQDGKSPLKGI